MMDVILSSGFLAFASHIGFLRALEEADVSVEGLCGTSSGALVGAMWMSGMSTSDIETELFRDMPLSQISFHVRFWQGLFSLRKLQDRLQELLPELFTDINAPFGVGVCTLDWESRIMMNGPVVDFVVASCSIPYLFSSVDIGGVRYCDGGAADRIGAAGWKEIRSEKEYLVHLVERSRGAKKEAGLSGCFVVRSPRSGASFFSFGDYKMRIERTRINTHEMLKKI
jgi:predicted acylesterase/phospholipase RssA